MNVNHPQSLLGLNFKESYLFDKILTLDNIVETEALVFGA